MKQIIFPSMSILPKISEIYRALGYTSKKTELKDVLEKDLNRYIEEAREIIELKGVCRRESVSNITEKEISLKNHTVLKSAALAKFLKGSTQVLLFGATAGSGIMDAIEKKTKEKYLTRAVVYNAVAGEMVDEALTWIEQYINQQIRRENLTLDLRRFSAGYGDFGIEYQKVFWQLLAFKEIGVSLSETYFLIPEKSVTAISGIRPS
jgi:hypothetical protein